MLSFREYCKPRFVQKEIRESRTRKLDTNTLLSTEDFIDFVRFTKKPMVWLKDDGNWYSFRFVDEIEEGRK